MHTIKMYMQITPKTLKNKDSCYMALIAIAV